MIGWAMGAFGVAAVGGLVMLVMSRGERRVPMGLALLHGLLAATGLVLLGVAVLRGGAGGLATWSLGVLLVAALGGFVLFAQYLRKGTFPFSLGLAHGLVAVVGFLLLVGWALG